MSDSGERVLVPKGPRARQRDDPDWATRVGDPPLPDWLVMRDYQVDAAEQVVKLYDDGCQVVFLDAPTGTGKTAIAELTRRRLGVRRGLYVCTTKSLQDQVAHDFEYARVLKGRGNYTPTNLTRADRGYEGNGSWGGLNITCRDCDAGPAGVPMDEKSCSYCQLVEECPYQIARHEAGRAAIGVLNTSFLLTHANGGAFKNSPFAGRELVIADECDLLEEELLGYVELRVGRRWIRELGIEVPKKGSHMTTIRAWLQEEVSEGLKGWLKQQTGRGVRDVETKRAVRRAEDLIADVRRVLEREDGWVRDGDEEDGDGDNRRGRGRASGDALVLKPVSVEDVGERYLWRHAERWLCMSGTIVSAETMAESLGLEEAGVKWGVVELPMRFPVEARRVKFAPVVSMTRKGQEQAGAMDKLLTAVTRVIERHEGENVLIHTHTYKLAREVREHLTAVGVQRLHTYQGANDRQHALDTFRRQGGILIAPSMDRGIDLPGDLCRVQIICKVPMASLGSRQVSERLRTPGGDAWYLANTCRTLMQMTGRAVRGMDDWAVCYVLDAHFSKVLGDAKRRGMFPQWWLDGLELEKGLG